MDGIPASDEGLLELSNVSIGVLTALPEEYAACKDVFDPANQGTEIERTATSGALNCWVCPVQAKHGGTHVVAIMGLSGMGTSAAAIGANILLQHCPAVRGIIMCGIAGAVPNPSDPEGHVRLGDVVVSNRYGIIQYDFGKQRDSRRDPDDPFKGFEFRGPPRPPCSTLLKAVDNITSDVLLMRPDEPRPWEVEIDEFLSRRGESSEWKRPARGKDRLDDSPNGDGKPIRPPRFGERRTGQPHIFHGPIGAANIVLADPQKRDCLRDHHGIKAVEMEGSGIADATWIAGVGYLVVRGTCDYCNATKNDIWHKYAALIAAAYSRTVVRYLHATSRVPPFVPASGASVIPKGHSAVAPMTPEQSSRAFRPSHADSDDVQPDAPARYENAPQVRFTSDSEEGHSSQQALPRASSVALYDNSAERQITELTQRLADLRLSGRLQEASQFVEELETQLRQSPRKGTVIREGWLELARVEDAFVRRRKINSGSADVSRLKALVEEAEGVTD